MSSFDTYLVGYYGMQNAGDDALMLASINGINRIKPFSKIKISTSNGISVANQRCFSSRLREQQSFRGQNRLTHYTNALASKSVVFGGGSVLHNSHDLRLKLQLLKLAGKKNSRAVGVSIGPFVDSKAEKYCAELLNRLSFVGVRDEQSLEIANAIAPNANCHLTFDLALGLLKDPSFNPSVTNRQGILVNVCPVAKDPSGNFDSSADIKRVKQLARALTLVHRLTGEHITVISLNGHQKLGDHSLCQKLMEELYTRVPVGIIGYHENPMKILKVVSSFKVCISMRLHGNVFAYMTGTPSISLNYHPKCDQWCEQIGQPNSHRVAVDDVDSDAFLNAITEGLENGFRLPTLDIESAVQKSLLNWK